MNRNQPRIFAGYRARRLQAAISLIELLVVVAVMAALAGLTMVSLPGLMESRGLVGGAMKMEGLLRLARETAISTQAPVAILLRKTGEDSDRKLALFRYNRDSGSWEPVTRWQELPAKVIVDPAFAPEPATGLGSLFSSPDTAGAAAITQIRDGATTLSTSDFDYAVFTEDGSLWPGSPAALLRVANGVIDGSEPRYTVDPDVSSVRLYVNNVTGQVKMIRDP